MADHQIVQQDAAPALHPIVAVALSKCVDRDELTELKDQIAEASTANFEFVAQVRGTLKRGKSTLAKPTASLLNEALFAECIRRLGVTRTAFEATLSEVATEALVAGIPIRSKLENEHPELLTVMGIIKRDVISQLPKQHRAGAIRCNTTLDVKRVRID